MKVSVCLVTCNGENFIERQLKSILSQTLLPDEIVLVDDFSNDNTVIISEKILVKSTINYCILQNDTRLGINRSFEKCLSTALFDIIVISDQDDFWFNDRLLTIRDNFLKQPSSELMLVNACIERDGVTTKESVNDYYPYTDSIFLNSIKNRFTGCQMAVKRNLLVRLYPFPLDSVCYYDHWISLFSVLRKTTAYIDSEQGYYCRHSNNVTDLLSSRSFVKLAISRFFLFFLVVKKYIFDKLYRV